MKKHQPRKRSNQKKERQKSTQRVTGAQEQRERIRAHQRGVSLHSASLACALGAAALASPSFGWDRHD